MRRTITTAAKRTNNNNHNHNSNNNNLNNNLNNSSNNNKRNITGLLGLGIGASYLLHRYTSPPQPVFPDPINNLLRQALVAEHRADLSNSQNCFSQAYQQSKQLLAHPQPNTPDRSQLDWIKLSGIGIRWAGLLERTGLIDQAIRVYDLVFNDLRAIHPDDHLHEPLTARAIEVAQKLAHLSSARIEASRELNPVQRAQLESKIEDYLSFSVQEILKLQSSIQDHSQRSGRDDSPADSLLSRLFGSNPDSNPELDLPPWVGRLNQASCFESLGSFYAQRGKIEYALPLYLQTLNILLPIKPNQASEDRLRRDEPDHQRSCHAATTMNNIASLLIKQSERNHHRAQDSGLLNNSVLWLEKSIDLSAKVLGNKHHLLDHPQLSECQIAHDTSKLNLANLQHKLDDLERSSRPTQVGDSTTTATTT